jgi:starvation-inducible DNA-binding protein
MTDLTKNEKIGDLLKPILADQHVIYTKTRNYHWNITGNMFFALHEKFEILYTELALEIDEIAERIRSLGVIAPGSMSEFLKLTDLKEQDNLVVPNQFKMVENLISDYSSIIDRMNSAAEIIQSEYKDEVTFGQLLTLSEKYQKHVWMLKSLIQN